MTMVSIYRYETATLPLKFKPTGVLNDYKHITRTTYLSKENDESDEEFNERYFKNVLFLHFIRKHCYS